MNTNTTVKTRTDVKTITKIKTMIRNIIKTINMNMLMCVDRYLFIKVTPIINKSMYVKMFINIEMIRNI